MVELYLHSLTSLHNIVRNQISTEKLLPCVREICGSKFGHGQAPPSPNSDERRCSNLKYPPYRPRIFSKIITIFIWWKNHTDFKETWIQTTFLRFDLKPVESKAIFAPCSSISQVSYACGIVCLELGAQGGDLRGAEHKPSEAGRNPGRCTGTILKKRCLFKHLSIRTLYLRWNTPVAMSSWVPQYTIQISRGTLLLFSLHAHTGIAYSEKHRQISATYCFRFPIWTLHKYSNSEYEQKWKCLFLYPLVFLHFNVWNIRPSGQSGKTGGWRKLRSRELYNLNSLPDIVRMIILRRMKISVGRPERKGLFGGHKRR
jgi:hypothetical protein